MNDLVKTEPPGVPAMVPAESSQIMAKVMELASSPNVNPEMFDRLVAWQEREQARQKQEEFNRDYIAAQMEMPRVKKDGVVEYAVNKNQPDGPKKEAFRFATIENIEDVVRPVEQKYGFAHLYTSKPRSGEGGGITTTITLIHKNGVSITSEFSAALDTSGGKSNLQGMHSSHSLAKRVALMSIWAIVHEGKDDSGMAGGISYITDEQEAQILALMKEVNADTARFLEFCEVDSVAEIQSKDFAAAINALNAKKKK